MCNYVNEVLSNIKEIFKDIDNIKEELDNTKNDENAISKSRESTVNSAFYKN